MVKLTDNYQTIVKCLTEKHMWIKRITGKLVLKLWGWKIRGELPKLDKYVIIHAPHTSNWDLLVGKFYNYAVGMKPTIIIKKEAFVFPINYILRWWGGVPLDRSRALNVVDQMADLFQKRKQIALAITPEGTRSKVKEWKTGFYRIAVKANVPIVLGFTNYATKECGVLGTFYPTGNMEEDLVKIQAYYKGIVGYYPQQGLN